MQIQWFPGHMAKAKRLIQENLSLVDLVIEVMDARVPLSGDNPEFDRMLGDKRRLMVFNRSDMADPAITATWQEYFKNKNIPCLFINSKERKQAMQVANMAYSIMADKIQAQKDKGRKPQPVRAMIVGIPNVGKSTLINSLAGRAAAFTGDKPGVTRGKQWIDVGNIQLLDTPGVLWPRFEIPDIGVRLAFTGAIKEDVLDVAELSIEFIKFLQDRYPEALVNRYGIADAPTMPALDLLETIGQKRGCRMSGGAIDYEKAASLIMHDFREGRMGKITVDRVEDVETFAAKAEELRLEQLNRGKHARSKAD
ncbi:MAG: ribosome biogenesis GTPase YlqF [Clostridia bacterium]|nr:ribosome biogenesis GTPase YlqF [Clostridia bacterium]